MFTRKYGEHKSTEELQSWWKVVADRCDTFQQTKGVDSTRLAPHLNIIHSLLGLQSTLDHGPSQQSCKEEYNAWKWGATERYYESYTKTMLPTRKSVQRSSRQPDHTKTSWPFKETQTEVVWTCLPSGPVKLILRGTVKGGRRQGIQKKCTKTTLGNGQA